MGALGAAAEEGREEMRITSFQSVILQGMDLRQILKNAEAFSDFVFCLAYTNKFVTLSKTQNPFELPFKRICLVGVRGFEPPTSGTPCRRANRATLHPELNWRTKIIL